MARHLIAIEGGQQTDIGSIKPFRVTDSLNDDDIILLFKQFSEKMLHHRDIKFEVREVTE